MNERIAALYARQQAGEVLKFRFFWGHSGTGVGPWVLSQWWEAPFVVGGATFRTAEHWMMAQKALLFEDEASCVKILAAASPGAAKALGRKVRDFDDEEWKGARFAIVRTGNVEKFRQHPALLEWLLTTGDTVLVEASPRDDIWGIGMSAKAPNVEDVTTWRGENLLGFALMDVRDRLRRFPDPKLPEGIVAPPWIAFPGVHPHEIAWRMGAGEAHMAELSRPWERLDADQRVQVELIYPATGPWSGWYDPK